jgi:hypothetical protein
MPWSGRFRESPTRIKHKEKQRENQRTLEITLRSHIHVNNTLEIAGAASAHIPNVRIIISPEKKFTGDKLSSRTHVFLRSKKKKQKEMLILNCLICLEVRDCITTNIHLFLFYYFTHNKICIHVIVKCRILCSLGISARDAVINQSISG